MSATDPTAIDTYPMPKDGWQCFHCGELFTTFGAARDHFGATPEAVVGCLLKIKPGEERGLLMALRKAEAAVEALRERNTMLLRKMGERAKWASDANDRAEAAEARVATLAVALEFITNMEGQEAMTDALFAEKALAMAHVALGATP